MDKRKLIFDTLDNKPAERAPVGFWFHFLKDKFDSSPAQIEKNIEGHKKFVSEFEPDMLKVMSDGFFTYPNEILAALKGTDDLKRIEPLSGSDWIDRQVEHAKILVELFGRELPVFYNVFAPATYLKFILRETANKWTVSALLKADPEALYYALEVISQDVNELIRRVITEGGADGVYYSCKNIVAEGVSKEQYLKTISPSDISGLTAASKYSSYNILHICGFEQVRTDLTIYKEYPFKAVNWPVVVDKVSLAEGKKLFGGRAVIGGFDDTVNGLLYSGTEKEIKYEAKRLLAQAGTVGVMLGANCTVPADIDIRRLRWVREAAEEFSAG